MGGRGREITSVRVAILPFPFVFAFKVTSGQPEVSQR
jgi:hypothetical protein